MLTGRLEAVDPGPALHFLTQAVAWGHDPRLLAKDLALQPLWGHPRFVRLAARPPSPGLALPVRLVDPLPGGRD